MKVKIKENTPIHSYKDIEDFGSLPGSRLYKKNVIEKIFFLLLFLLHVYMFILLIHFTSVEKALWNCYGWGDLLFMW
jgi:hypothetical protein